MPNRSDRRGVLAAGLACTVVGCVRPVLTEPIPQFGVFVPGYRAGDAVDEVTLDHLPTGYHGDATMLTRIASDGEVIRARFPIRGHGVAISKRRGLGVFAAMRGDRFATFDPETLQIRSLADVSLDGRSGGGHARFVNDDSLIATSERVSYAAYDGDPTAHYGRIALRDPADLAVLERYSSHGIAPHDIAPIPGTRLLAVANYGSTLPPDGRKRPSAYVVEPSITIIDLDDGRLVEKLHGLDPAYEIRHLTALEDAVFAIQVRTGDRLAAAHSLDRALRAIGDEFDETADPATVYLPAPMLFQPMASGLATEVGRSTIAEQRQGLSIVYDPAYDQIIASFPSSHRVIAIDRQSLSVRASINTREFGLTYPCGVALLPDGENYVVTGSFENLAVVRRDDHRPEPQKSLQIRLFRHSHIAIA